MEAEQVITPVGLSIMHSCMHVANHMYCSLTIATGSEAAEFSFTCEPNTY